MSGTVVKKTGPVSARVQLDNGTVIRRHQDHVRSRENDVAEELATSVTPNVTPVVLRDCDATPPTPGVSDQLEVPNSSPEAPTQTPETPDKCPLGTRPVRKRVRPGYLKDYLCEL